jgi:ankyrin repeat protein
MWPERTALHLAASKGRLAVVEALIKSGADVNQPDTVLMTAVHWAAMHGHSDVVQAPVEAGANSSLKNRKDETALDLAPG